ncbi:MAG TPA: hypothetical protein VG013_07500 [Gemmataceae bacterium]|jgi:hypothetical protein|nr:hypothetical protein [Gemmataceae bacterium]
MDQFLEKHSSELIILVIAAMVLGALLVLVPQLLRARRHTADLQHAEQMRALEHGQVLYAPDEPSRAAGLTALLVPIVVIISAGTVTCFLSAFKSESLISVSLAVWSVAGLVGLAAITGGVALMGRLAQLHADKEDEKVPLHPLEK